MRHIAARATARRVRTGTLPLRLELPALPPLDLTNREGALVAVMICDELLKDLGRYQRRVAAELARLEAIRKQQVLT